MAGTILAMPNGNFLSHMSRPLAIAKKLREMGYNVVFAGDGDYMKLPRNDGFEVHTIKTIDLEYSLSVSRKGRLSWYDYSTIDEHVQAELALFAKVQPDLVLNDFRPTLGTSCEMANIPLVCILNASWTNYSTVRVRAPDHLRVTQILGRGICDAIAPMIKEYVLKKDSAPFRQYRKDKALSQKVNMMDIWTGDLNLLTDIPEYGPTQNLPGNFRYIGPITWEPDLTEPEWLAKLDPQKTTLYFTMGSTGFPRFFEQAIELFKDLAYQCIMTTGGMVDIPNSPPNFYITDFAPGSALLAKSDVVICHGGNGTIYQALGQGVPIIGIPTMHDQEFNLDRVEALGVGIQLNELKFKPIHLLDAIKLILTNKEFKQNAEKYKQHLCQYNGPLTGALLIAEYLENKTTQFANELHISKRTLQD